MDLLRSLLAKEEKLEDYKQDCLKMKRNIAKILTTLHIWRMDNEANVCFEEEI